MAQPATCRFVHILGPNCFIMKALPWSVVRRNSLQYVSRNPVALLWRYRMRSSGAFMSPHTASGMNYV
jgi:hypothetical protein